VCSLNNVRYWGAAVWCTYRRQRQYPIRHAQLRDHETRIQSTQTVRNDVDLLIKNLVMTLQVVLQVLRPLRDATRRIQLRRCGGSRDHLFAEHQE